MILLVGAAREGMVVTYDERLEKLQSTISGCPSGALRITKRTTSNLFRYQGRQATTGDRVSLRDFNHVLGLCSRSRTLEVEGLATYEQIVDATLPHGFLPTVTPELKHITIGGATVGIGIESSCHRHGFVHDGLVEADVLLPDGRVVTCTADNAHAELFHALPNSYGTLGYILRAKIRLIPAQPYVRVRHTRYRDVTGYLEAMQQAVSQADSDFIEGLFYDGDALYLTRGELAADAPDVVDIYETIYYKTAGRISDFFLPTKQYIFRYDPDWFWNVPDSPAYNLFRRLAPRALRNSGFYNRYSAWKNGVLAALKVPRNKTMEPLIQDWQVPWEQAEHLIGFVLEHVDLKGYPWVALPIVPQSSPTLYPLEPQRLYFNLGCYCLTPKPQADREFHYTRIIDEECFRLGGLKMLYSSTFMDRQSFDRSYNGTGYERLKRRYDPEGRVPSLFEKAVEGVV
ncbi:MAG: FAD-binding oxidoreductase [Ectothiorhodospiraceae bacterium]|nr:FAD-binding oxidoreductase [Ectothiorhodospiraceae bacterium]